MERVGYKDLREYRKLDIHSLVFSFVAANLTLLLLMPKAILGLAREDAMVGYNANRLEVDEMRAELLVNIVNLQINLYIDQ